MTDDTAPKGQVAQKRAAEREKKLAAELRANLKRRKAGKSGDPGDEAAKRVTDD